MYIRKGRPTLTTNFHVDFYFFFLGHTGNEGFYYKFKDVNDYGKDVPTYSTQAPYIKGNAEHACGQVCSE